MVSQQQSLVGITHNILLTSVPAKALVHIWPGQSVLMKRGQLTQLPLDRPD